MEDFQLDGMFTTRAEKAAIKRWKAAAKGRRMTFGQWVRVTLEEGSLRGEERPIPVARDPEVAGTVGGGRTEETREAVTGPVRALDSYARGREVARELAQKEGRCTADVTKGVRCRLCGKMH